MKDTTASSKPSSPACFAALAILVLTAGALAAQNPAPPKPLVAGVNQANFDKSERPQDDFYRYVNGTWLKQTSIPPDRSNYGAFTILEEKAEKDIRAIVEELAAKNNPPGSEARR
jgi:endothelin-converting enzyme